MQLLFLIFAVVQAVQPTVARGDRFQIVVPQGWKVASAARDVVLEHSTGASLLVRRPVPASPRNLDTFAYDAVERIMTPLGFAKREQPRRFRNGREEAVQYEIRGNRLSEHRRILYRAIRRDPTTVFEMVYENSEDRFDILIAEAQAIAASLEIVIEAPPPQRGAPRRAARD